MKRGAIFDMDGLMFDTEALWQAGWRTLAKKFGYEPSDGFGRDISGTSGQQMIDVVQTYYPGIDAEAFIGQERELVEKQLAESVPIKPGLLTLLDFFRDHGVRMAVASSSQPEMIQRNLHMADVADYFAVVLSSTQVAHAKPAPDVFLRAAELLGLPASDCYVFEDSFGGVRAGHAAGAVTVMVPDQRQPTEEIRALTAAVCDDLAQVAERIGAGEL